MFSLSTISRLPAVVDSSVTPSFPNPKMLPPSTRRLPPDWNWIPISSGGRRPHTVDPVDTDVVDHDVRARGGFDDDPRCSADENRCIHAGSRERDRIRDRDRTKAARVQRVDLAAHSGLRQSTGPGLARRGPAARVGVVADPRNPCPRGLCERARWQHEQNQHPSDRSPSPPHHAPTLLRRSNGGRSGG